MNKKLLYPAISAVIIIVVIVWWWYCQSITSIIFVRHADRDGNNDTLDAAGVIRAAHLVQVAEISGVTAIYHSTANRTRLTVQPLASALGIIMTEQGDPAATVSDIYSNRRGETVIVAGHSNTTPEMIELAGGPAGLVINDDEYDNLFLLTRCHCWFGPTRLVNLQYGEPSP